MKNIENMPKIELHVHIEGTLEAKTVLAKIEQKQLNFDPMYLEKLSKPPVFTSLSDFLKDYYKNMAVLENQQDFFDLAWNHLKNAKKQNVIYTEIFFDPQPHIKRGIHLYDVIDGLYQALEKAEKELDLKAKLIMCFLKDESVDEALNILDMSKLAIENKKIVGIGFDSNEIENWAAIFKPVVDKARNLGLNVTTHAAENSFEQDPIEVINILNPDRIDHGLYIHKSLEALKLVKEKEIHLSLCPLPNFYSKAWLDPKTFPIQVFLDNDISFSINSDDPAYFGPTTLNDNYLLVNQNNKISEEKWKNLLLKTLNSTFTNTEEKEYLKEKIENYFK
ncbi:adenosine deaminase [Mesoplasma florum]|uniref:adenosine deaminase n=1 Tax=Mesoplasma florum TaxID=2151 RepID=UPI000BE3EB6F|nr:adenosine deaminase [Mesoplasma florum]ATI73857.1 adenosine deaminase [Mesoplasma florum]